MVSTTLNIKNLMKEVTKLHVSKDAFAKIIKMVERYTKTLTETSGQQCKDNGRKTIMAADVDNEFDDHYKEDIVDILLKRFDNMVETIGSLKNEIKELKDTWE